MYKNLPNINLNEQSQKKIIHVYPSNMIESHETDTLYYMKNITFHYSNIDYDAWINRRECFWCFWLPIHQYVQCCNRYHTIIHALIEYTHSNNQIKIVNELDNLFTWWLFAVITANDTKNTLDLQNFYNFFPQIEFVVYLKETISISSTEI